MTEVIAATTAAMTAMIAVYANVHVMRLCRKALRDGHDVQARFGLIPSVKIQGRCDGNLPELAVVTRRNPRSRTRVK